MSLLQYTSNEMFSSTELVRKNKNIFDKLNKKEIEKAVILRDGKPNIILLDFYEYEKIIGEYLKLKESTKNSTSTKENKKIENKDLTIKEESTNDGFKISLEDIDNMDLSFDSKTSKDKSEALKEFWD